MAASLIRNTLKSVSNRRFVSLLSTRHHQSRLFSNSSSTAQELESDSSSSSFTFSDKSSDKNDTIDLRSPNSKPAPSSVSMPMSFMTGSIVGKRFYNKVTVRKADDGNGWTVMLDYRTFKSPSKKALKLPTLPLAKAIAAEWDYQLIDGIRPFTMPLMKLACTALERVPLTRTKVIEHLIQKFNLDLVFCRAPNDTIRTIDIHETHAKKIDPLLHWIESEFGFKPIVYSSIFGGKQEDGLVKAMENLLKKADDCELAAIDAIASSAHSLVIAIGIFRGRLQIDDAIELIRLEEDFQVDKWGLVEGGHDIDIADLRVQISSTVVFLGLSRRH